MCGITVGKLTYFYITKKKEVLHDNEYFPMKQKYA